MKHVNRLRAMKGKGGGMRVNFAFLILDVLDPFAQVCGLNRQVAHRTTFPSLLLLLNFEPSVSIRLRRKRYI